MKHALLALSLLLFAACRDSKGAGQNEKRVESGSSTGSAAATAGSSATDSTDEASADETVGQGSGSAYVPAEFKSGMAKWRDCGVYVDGQPVGFLTFGELPIALKPVFVQDEVSVNKPPGCPECPDRKKSSMRYYRFLDLMAAYGIDVKKVKMVHVLAPKASQTIAATGHDLQTPLAKDFMFRFGSLVGGKPLPHTPEGFGNEETPDKLVSVMIYINRKPPTITPDGLVLDGVEQMGVPYYGEPVRGGIRIYLDDRLATMVKRQELDVKLATQLPDGSLQWPLQAFLASKGVDTSKVVEGWVIRDDKRTERIPWSELSKMSFTATSQGKGHIALGDKQIIANSLALHTRTIKDDELPVIRPDEVW
jgi:hypothetical protein